MIDYKLINKIDHLLIEFDEMGFTPTTVCENPEKYAIEWREKVRAEFKRLEIENAELKATDVVSDFVKKLIDFPHWLENGTVLVIHMEEFLEFAAEFGVDVEKLGDK